MMATPVDEEAPDRTLPEGLERPHGGAVHCVGHDRPLFFEVARKVGGVEDEVLVEIAKAVIPSVRRDGDGEDPTRLRNIVANCCSHVAWGNWQQYKPDRIARRFNIGEEDVQTVIDWLQREPEEDHADEQEAENGA